MAEATVPRTRRQESIAHAEKKRQRVSVPGNWRLRPDLLTIWVALVIGAGVFVRFGTVEIGAGNWLGRAFGVREIWSRFPAYLTIQGFSQNVITLIVAALGLACLGSAVLLWLSLALRNDSQDPQPHREPSVTGE